MKKQNELALIIAYYLSKYDKAGFQNLGYASFTDASKDIGKKLRVKASSVQNWRDEFDPIHSNNRVGWYQRPMSPSRVRTVELFSSISEPTLRGIVKDIIEGKESLPNAISEVDKVSGGKTDKKRKFILRGPTGKKAEELFIGCFRAGESPLSGILKDCRDMGVGYDFEINKRDSENYYVEVKGLDGYTGGIVFTDKEWRTACEKGDLYYLVVITGISESPDFSFYRNPAAKFEPNRNISTTITVSWNVTQKQMGTIKNG